MDERYTLLHLLDVEQSDAAKSLQIRSVARVDTASGGRVLVVNTIQREVVIDGVVAFKYTKPDGSTREVASTNSVTLANMRRIAKEDTFSVDKLLLQPGWSRGSLLLPLSMLNELPNEIGVRVIYQRRSKGNPDDEEIR